MQKIILSLVVCSFLSSLHAQELYMPRNIKKAYANGTRSYDGKPGKNYWQNHGQYNMQLAVDANTKVVSGTEDIFYENNSPDTLQTLTLRFVNNIHQPEAARGGDVSSDFLDDGLKISAFTIDGNTYIGKEKRIVGTVSNIKLRAPILPHSKTKLHIEWNYPLSKQSGREGQIDSTTFYVAYSYPRVSVFDDYNGWDRIPHSDRQEFYNDFNDYEFSVKAPKNYVVWATGDFLNPEEVLQPEIAKRLKQSYTSDDVLHIASFDEIKKGAVTKQDDWNTWKFSVKNISDVCFGLSNHYAWDASSVIADNKTGRRASTQAAYGENGTDFVHSVKWNNYAMQWFSNNWPGVPYPFSKMTAFQGFADMEYPMMVNDSQVGDTTFARLVQNHEVAHTYFPFYMGINETRYAYMDEGWATTLEYLIGLSYDKKENVDDFYKKFRVNRYIKDPSAEEDQPVITMSTQVSGAGYGNNSYGKASLSYLALKDMLGDELFKKCLHEYMARWNGKHPIPWDYFYSINSASGQNLNWFWNNWFFSNNYIDLAIEKVNKNKSDYTVSVKNIGGFAIPFDLIATFEDGSQQALHQTSKIWETNQQRINILIPTNKKIKQIKIDGGIFMDANEKDNELQVTN